MNYEFNTHIGDKLISCRAFTLRENISLLEARSKNDPELFKNVFRDLIKNCTNAKNLSKHESELLLIKLMAKSLHQDLIKSTYVCDCGKEIEIPIDYTQSYIDIPDGEQDLTFTFQKFKIKFRYPKLFEDDNIPLMVSSCIEVIYANNESLELDDLNEHELNSLYESITVEDLEIIKNRLLAPKPVIGVPIKCDCGKSSVQVIKGFKEFFRIM